MPPHSAPPVTDNTVHLGREPPTPLGLDSATPAVLVVVLVFVLPSRLEAGRPAPALLDWTTVEQKLPWGVILLLGGGFALADITDKGGRAVRCMCGSGSLQLKAYFFNNLFTL